MGKNISCQTTGSDRSDNTMRIGFYVEGVCFQGDTLQKRPLGGSETAIIHIARALAKRGHLVSVFNRCETPGIYDGVEYHSADTIAEFSAKDPLDVLICQRYFKPFILDVCAKAKVYWSEDAYDQPFVQPLYQRELLEKIDRIFVVSRWQAESFKQNFRIPPEKIYITRNGVHWPSFKNITSPRNKRKIIYTSTPYRGLDILLDIFPAIRRSVCDAQLYIYSSMLVYGVSTDEDELQFQTIYQKAIQPGVYLHKSILQYELAEELKTSTVFAYPNIFAETSCIAALEAQAAGCPVVTSSLGALPETVEDGVSGILIPGDPHEAQYQEKFIETVVLLLHDRKRWKALSENARERICEKFTWGAIAEEWEEELIKIKHECVSLNIPRYKSERHDLLFEQAKALKEQKQYAQALEICLHLMSSEPKNGLFYFFVGDICSEMGKGSEAEFFRKKAFELDPGLALAKHEEFKS